MNNNDENGFKNLENKLDKLEVKFDKIGGHLDSINSTLIRQEESLKYHILRTDLAEENIKLLKDNFDKRTDSINKQIEPIQAHVNMVVGVGKFIGYVSVVSGIVYTFIQIFKG